MPSKPQIQSNLGIKSYKIKNILFKGQFAFHVDNILEFFDPSSLSINSLSTGVYLHDKTFGNLLPSCTLSTQIVNDPKLFCGPTWIGTQALWIMDQASNIELAYQKGFWKKGCLYKL